MISHETSWISSLLGEFTVESESRLILLKYSLPSISSNHRRSIHVVIYNVEIRFFLLRVSKNTLIAIRLSWLSMKQKKRVFLSVSFQNQKSRKISRFLLLFLDLVRGRRSNEKSLTLRRVISDMIQHSDFLRYIQELSKPISFSRPGKVEHLSGLSHLSLSESWARSIEKREGVMW